MAAKMVAVKDLTEGNILADAVLSVSGKILLGKNVVLTTRHISLLNTWDVKSVFINVDEEQIQEAPAEETVKEASRKINSEEYFHFVQEYDSIVTNTAQTFDFIRKRKIIPVSHLKDTVGNIHSSIVNNSFEVMNYLLVSDHKLAEFIPRHSVMVAYFAGIIARQMKWSEDDIQGVALASLMHDIGNLAIDKIDDPRARAHIAEAARMLREAKGLSSEVILGIVQHRECINGSGFPTGAKGSQIHPYAKIIAVADLFHNSAYTDEYANPFPVLDMLAREMYGKFDPDVCQTFISRVRNSLLFNKILLSSGQEAEVIFFHPNGYCLPVVRTVDGQIIDLSQRGGLTINRMVTPA